MEQTLITKEELKDIFLFQINLLDEMPKSFTDIQDSQLYEDVSTKVNLFLSLLEGNTIDPMYYSHIQDELNGTEKIILALYKADQK